jgi:hypothetical protein
MVTGSPSDDGGQGSISLAERPMIRTLRIAVSGLATAGLFAACSNDLSSPIPIGGAQLSGSTGGGGTSTGGGTVSGGGTGAKAPCTNALTISGSATEALTGNAFSASYVLTACQSKTRVSMTATDVATGAVVWNSVPDLAGTIAIWTLPYTLTSYRIDARAVAGSTNTLVATASTIVSTLDVLPCTPFVHETATVGYWGIYPAVWAATDAQDCGRSGTVHLRITNLSNDRIERNYPTLGMSSFIDFEGATVSYNTPYRIYAELVSRDGQILSTSSTDIVSSPLR